MNQQEKSEFDNKLARAKESIRRYSDLDLRVMHDVIGYEIERRAEIKEHHYTMEELNKIDAHITQLLNDIEEYKKKNGVK